MVMAVVDSPPHFRRAAKKLIMRIFPRMEHFCCYGGACIYVILDVGKVE